MVHNILDNRDIRQTTGAEDNAVMSQKAVTEALAALQLEGGGNGADGVGIESIEKTATNGLIDTYTVTLTNGETYAFTVTNGEDGADGTNGKDGTNGTDGKDGVDGKTPYIQNGYWYIDGVNTNVKAEGTDGADGKDGAQGEKGDKGDTGAKGDKGDKGDTGANGKDGTNGTNGKDGVSVTHSWNGTTLTVTSASGTSSADLKGDKGDKGETGAQGERGIQGIQGEQGVQGEKGDKGDKGDTGAAGVNGTNGKDGTSVTVSSVSESTESGGTNVVTFSDGKTLNIQNGKDGKDGASASDSIEILLPSEAVAVVGVEFNIYYKNIVWSNRALENYDIKISLSDTSIDIERYAECFRITPIAADVGDYTLTVQIMDRSGYTVLAQKTMALHIIENRTVANKKVLYIGDSLTFSRGGLYAAEIQYNLSNGGLVSIGSQTGAQASNQVGEVKHEGYNGATVGGFLSANITSSFANPFYNPTSKTFDLAYFMTNQGYSQIDAVCLNLGHNNIGNTANAVTGLTTIAEKIHTYNANIPVIISLIEPLAGQDSWRDNSHNTAEQMRRHWRNLLNAYITAFDNGKISNVYLSAPYFNVDPDNDFPTETVARSARDTTQIVRQNDSMHPNRIGTLKMADAYFANLLYRIPDTGAVYYTVTNNLTDVTNSNGAETVKEGSAYTATLSPASGLILDTVSVTMGGQTVSVTNGVINIASVTGDIVITATAKSSVNNLVDPSTATSSPDTTTLFKDEWANGYYISASALSAKTGCITTDVFPVTRGQKLKIEGVLLSTVEHKNRFRWWLFDADGSRPYGSYINFASGEVASGTIGTSTFDADNNTAIIDFSGLNNSFAKIAYARFSCYSAGTNEQIIVSVVE